MAAMATAASMVQCANFATSTRVSTTRGNARLPAARRMSLVVRAAGDPERIDKFFDGARQEAGKNASNFGDQVAQAAGNVEKTIKDVGRDMGGKTQEALDAAGGRADEMAGELDDVREDIASGAKNPLSPKQSVGVSEPLLENLFIVFHFPALSSSFWWCHLFGNVLIICILLCRMLQMTRSETR